MKGRRVFGSLLLVVFALGVAAPVLADDPDLGGAPGPIYQPPPGGGPGEIGGGPTQARCFQDYVDCLNRAAQLPDWFARAAAGVDCWINFMGCVYKVFH